MKIIASAGEDPDLYRKLLAEEEAATAEIIDPQTPRVAEWIPTDILKDLRNRSEALGLRASSVILALVYPLAGLSNLMIVKPMAGVQNALYAATLLGLSLAWRTCGRGQPREVVWANRWLLYLLALVAVQTLLNVLVPDST